ncbi:hypothetical protein SGFS_103930 [Streptomyces graminofaciens]|uniref:Uncharacterized protein n=1 Tax=Streptomyces graminofaciens TaxID=68212 RepID=A0ABN5W0A4_9ACTN|nr:hypothetical protein [Streptomyces graminofaciens]BBC39099.1 hypothetical protein SGFS_103930 [Streptomyces graminofaciens]
MKLNVLINERGELVAATSGPIGIPEDVGTEASKADTQPVAFIVPLQGQTVQEVEVPEHLIDVNSTSEFHKYVVETFSR